MYRRTSTVYQLVFVKGKEVLIYLIYNINTLVENFRGCFIVDTSEFARRYIFIFSEPKPTIVNVVSYIT